MEIFINPGNINGKFLTSMEEIERLTGLNFLEKLPDQIYNEVEALTAQRYGRIRTRKEYFNCPGM